jgi:hypothetical protein
MPVPIIITMTEAAPLKGANFSKREDFIIFLLINFLADGLEGRTFDHRHSW